MLPGPLHLGVDIWGMSPPSTDGDGKALPVAWMVEGHRPVQENGSRGQRPCTVKRLHVLSWLKLSPPDAWLAAPIMFVAVEGCVTEHAPPPDGSC